MGKITKQKTREIIGDFVTNINDTRRDAEESISIKFRNEDQIGKKRPVYFVPTELLRYRKNNGRIRSAVITYEKEYGLLTERDEKAQEIVRNFLEDIDKEKTKELKQTIEYEGQREPTIITCDGFLINGNRRKMVLKKLAEEGKSQFEAMKVVILPGKGDEGGPPTLLEIEEIENRYQHQHDGKAEYSKFNIALSTRRKIDMGMNLVRQLRDDPVYAGLPKKEFDKAIKDFERNYLDPLKCIDIYLKHFNREGLYDTIASGPGDPEGRWEALSDYSSKVYKKLSNPKYRMKLKIDETELGDIEDVIFKIIRKRSLPSLPKAHEVVRNIPKLLENNDSKKELLKLVAIETELPKKERRNQKGEMYSPRELDQFWGKKHAEDIIRQVRKAYDYSQYKKERETPLTLLEAALRKLNHPDMDSAAITKENYQKAMKLTRDIQDRADELESEFYRHNKNFKKLKENYSRSKKSQKIKRKAH